MEIDRCCLQSPAVSDLGQHNPAGLLGLRYSVGKTLPFCSENLKNSGLWENHPGMLWSHSPLFKRGTVTGDSGGDLGLEVYQSCRDAQHLCQQPHGHNLAFAAYEKWPGMKVSLTMCPCGHQSCASGHHTALCRGQCPRGRPLPLHTRHSCCWPSGPLLCTPQDLI